MTVETSESNAELFFQFKKEIPKENYRLILFIQNDSTTRDFTLEIDSSSYQFDPSKLSGIGKNAIEIKYSGAINEIRLTTGGEDGSRKKLRFFGIDIENEKNSGVVYHSLGVGAAAMRSVLYLDKMPEHAAILKPDIAIIDFGTNDILYTNSIDARLPGQIVQAIRQFRAVNPEMVIILTSLQDLYRNGKFITAGPAFRDMIDSIARAEGCMFWNWYDLSGGLGTIQRWQIAGYAQKDYIHLTADGYRIKGECIYRAFRNTYSKLKDNPDLESLVIPMRDYGKVAAVRVPVKKESGKKEQKLPEKASADNIPSAAADTTAKTVAVVSLPEKPMQPNEVGTSEKSADNHPAIKETEKVKPVEVEKPKAVQVKKSPPKTENKKPVNKKKTAAPKEHQLKDGDNLWTLARKYHTTVDKIKKANGMKDDFLRVGKKLKIPKS
jgi:LysM repeat protein/lysophospholipase L1-like esterase